MSGSEKAENTTYRMEVVIHKEEEKVVGKEDKDVCVCRVPKSLIGGHPEAFSPQFVGLGPYHHPRLDLTMTDVLKKAAAMRIMNDDFKIQVSDVQPFYHKDTLNSYAHDKHKLLEDITMDGFFLLALINWSLDAQPPNHTYFLTGKHGMPLVNALGVELTIGAVIRDVFMLENQIPTRLLHQINQATPQHGIQSHLGAKMLHFCKMYCPLAKPQILPENTKVTHLLDLMYHLVAPMPSKTANTPPSPQVHPEVEPEVYPEVESEVESEAAPEVALEVQPDNEPDTARTEEHEPAEVTTEVEVKVEMPNMTSIFVKLFISLLPVPRGLMADTTRKNSMAPDERKTIWMGIQIPKQWVNKIRQRLFGEEDKRPAVTIQSVTELDDAGFHFKPVNSLQGIRFEVTKKILFLPVLKLDENSEVIMRNLVAYESLTRDTYLIFTRYVEIMRAIIDTPEDVKLLVQNKIIETKLSDKVVTDLFNGMSTSIRPTKTDELEEMILEVKIQYEESQWLQKMVRYVYSSWKILTAIAAFSFFVLTSVQTFCSVYDCASHFSTNLERLPAVSNNGLISYI
ncbi:hypothetical protein DEO72_LG9g1096 [Vigna unguiculata]|uniref:Uncharacterized protein n=1 Tax=Vigna unguiculata TaxID=3917 RepID=A0A4D6N1Y3_VIGUN|nr:hypothetical protein DEO72_LG9g1096 [Vigna unguiculata]